MKYGELNDYTAYICVEHQQSGKKKQLTLQKHVPDFALIPPLQNGGHVHEVMSTLLLLCLNITVIAKYIISQMIYRERCNLRKITASIYYTIRGIFFLSLSTLLAGKSSTVSSTVLLTVIPWALTVSS
jgi:hypothetical protein